MKGGEFRYMYPIKHSPRLKIYTKLTLIRGQPISNTPIHLNR